MLRYANKREKRWPPNTGALSLHGPSPSLGAPRYVGHFPVALRFIRPLPEAICNYPKYTQSNTQRAPPKCMIRLIHAPGQVGGVDSTHAACLPWRQRIVYLETLVLGVRDVRENVRVTIDSETRPWQSASDSCDLLRRHAVKPDSVGLDRGPVQALGHTIRKVVGCRHLGSADGRILFFVATVEVS